MLGQAAAWLDSMRVAYLSRTVTYSRGAESVELSATLGSTSYEVTDDAGATVRAKATDFIVSPDALVVGGVKVTPQLGDRIEMTAGERVLVFEVLALPGGEHFRPADPLAKALRIHAKHVDTA